MGFAKILPISQAPAAALSALGPTRKVLISGGAQANDVAMRVTAAAACRRRRVRFLSGDNRFDPYLVARVARSLGAQPEAALDAIWIARAFTAYQMVELIERLDEAALGDVVVIGGPCSPFFDEDLTHTDAARLFYRMFWRAAALAASGMTLLMVQGETPHAARRDYFLKDLGRLSEVVLDVSGPHTFTLERRRRVALPRLPRLELPAGM